jgi:hypothetical protein
VHFPDAADTDEADVQSAHTGLSDSVEDPGGERCVLRTDVVDNVSVRPGRVRAAR